MLVAVIPAVLWAQPEAGREASPETVDSIPVEDPDAVNAEPARGDVLVLDDFIVRGENVARSLQDTGSSVSVLTAEEIEASSMTDLYDAFQRTANVNESHGKLGGYGGFVIRGITDTGVTDASFSSTAPLATILVDGVPLSAAGARAGPLDFWDVESVEFLRGPQSTNIGQGALAGAIVMRTRDPDEQVDVRARYRAGDYGTRQFAAAAGGPLAGGFSMRVSTQHSESDGAAYNITRNEPSNFEDVTSLRGKLRWQAEAWRDADVLLTVTRSETLFGQGQLSGDPEDRESVANDPEQLQSQAELASLRAGLSLSDAWSAESVTGYVATDLRTDDDYNYSAEPDGVIINTNDDRTWTQQISASFEGLSLLGMPVRGTLGVYGAALATDSTTDVIDGDLSAFITGGQPIGLFFDLDTDVTQSRRSTAVFGEMDWLVGERWTLTTGVRFDQDTVDYAYLSDSSLSVISDNESPLGEIIADVLGDLGGSAALPADGEGAGTQASSAVLPKLGLRLDVTEFTAVGLQVQQAFRAGGLSVNFVRGTFNTFEPEYTTTYELYARTEWLDGRVKLRSNVYYTDWRDQQVSVQLSDDANDTQTENAGRSRLIGGELELDAQLGWGVSGFVSAGYAETEFLDFNSTAGDFEGNEFPGAPEKQGGIGLRVERGGRWPYAQLDLNYVDSTFRRANNDADQTSDSYALLNGRVGYRFRHVELYVSGRNLLDRFYLVQRAFGTFQAGQPRTLIGGVEVILG
ncbi:MAG: TonB-dependent receptor [Pseudomonadota bacterium]|nr:TonB-dependent receptor [Pseudomonadota bacterium]